MANNELNVAKVVNCKWKYNLRKYFIKEKKKGHYIYKMHVVMKRFVGGKIA